MAAKPFILYLGITLLWSLVVVIARADELSERGRDAAGATTQPAMKRWYTNLEEAKRVAHETGRPIMVVFR